MTHTGNDLRKLDAQAAFARIEDMRAVLSELENNPEVGNYAAGEALHDADDALARAQVDLNEGINEYDETD